MNLMWRRTLARVLLGNDRCRASTEQGDVLAPSGLRAGAPEKDLGKTGKERERGSELPPPRPHSSLLWVAACRARAIKARPTLEVRPTSKRIIQVSPLFDYGQSSDLPSPVNTMHFIN